MHSIAATPEFAWVALHGKRAKTPKAEAATAPPLQLLLFSQSTRGAALSARCKRFSALRSRPAPLPCLLGLWGRSRMKPEQSSRGQERTSTNNSLLNSISCPNCKEQNRVSNGRQRLSACLSRLQLPSSDTFHERNLARGFGLIASACRSHRHHGEQRGLAEVRSGGSDMRRSCRSGHCCLPGSITVRSVCPPRKLAA